MSRHDFGVFLSNFRLLLSPLVQMPSDEVGDREKGSEEMTNDSSFHQGPEQNVWIQIQTLTLPDSKTASLLLKIGISEPPKRKCHLNQPLIFRGKLDVSFREG